jgi:hypothetical protein
MHDLGSPDLLSGQGRFEKNGITFFEKYGSSMLQNR